jgi:hypothetical protein
LISSGEHGQSSEGASLLQVQTPPGEPDIFTGTP